VAVLAGLADEAVEEFERDDFEEPEAVVGGGGLGVRRVVKRARGGMERDLHGGVEDSADEDEAAGDGALLECGVAEWWLGVV
jgi:hypothetical protein